MDGTVKIQPHLLRRKTNTTCQAMNMHVQEQTFFISWKVLMVWPWAHDSKADMAMDSISGISFRTVSGDNEPLTSFLSWVWYSPWWKNRAEGPISLSLLLGYVGLNKWAWVTSMNLAASGLANMTHGQPSMWVLNISPYLKWKEKTRRKVDNTFEGILEEERELGLINNMNLSCFVAKKTFGSWE